MSEQATTQPEEVKEPQQAGEVQVDSASDKVVDSTEKQVEESKSTEQSDQQQVEPEQEKSVPEQNEPVVSEPVEEKAVTAEDNVAENGTKALDGDEPKVEQAEEAKESATVVDAPVEEKKTPVVEAGKMSETNGESVVEPTTDQQPPQVTEETNGVSKRKAENGADAVEEEKSPKKAKVVDEADQSAQAVEERAA